MAADDAAKTGAPSEGKTSTKKGVLLAGLLCALGAALGFFGLSSGLIPMGFGQENTPEAHVESSALPDVAFVDIPTLIVTLPSGASNTHLRFSGQIEVPSNYQSDVEYLLPRIQDVMNGYLSALTIEDIEGPGALFKIRLHLFRRIVMVVGLGKANSLLVTEFILN
jgi:flagellar FliL protein